MTANNSQIILYQTEDGKIKIETRIKNESVWLSQMQLCELFNRSKATISEHIKHIFEEEELEEKVVVRDFRTTTQHGAIQGKTQSKDVKHYNLELIISVGYRVKSPQGTKFRQWATARLKEYIVKGFTMNDDLLKEAGGGNYFDELLARIRDIRSSEKVFWRKILDIYATSVDYEAKSDLSIKFFKTIQNKMHWAAHGHTAAEIVYERANSGKPFLGLTSFKGSKPTKKESEIAKNYLEKNELDILNRMVTAYLEVAELQALNQKPMHMKDWLTRLDGFLTMTGNTILNHAGKVSHHKALAKAHSEYELYKERTKNDLSKIEEEFIKTIESETKKLKK